MKKQSIALLMTLALAGSAFTLTAQDKPDSPPPAERSPRGPGGPGGPGGPSPEGFRPPMAPPLMQALDPNRDGIIDEVEIAKASELLRTLDKNGDGKLTPEELRPQPPEGERGPGLRPPGQSPAFRRPPGEQPGGEGRPPRRPPGDR
jgi:hypothetical protein